MVEKSSRVRGPLARLGLVSRRAQRKATAAAAGAGAAVGAEAASTQPCLNVSSETKSNQSLVYGVKAISLCAEV